MKVNIKLLERAVEEGKKGKAHVFRDVNSTLSESEYNEVATQIKGIMKTEIEKVIQITEKEI